MVFITCKEIIYLPHKTGILGDSHWLLIVMPVQLYLPVPAPQHMATESLATVLVVSNPVFSAIAAGGLGEHLTETMPIRFSLPRTGDKELKPWTVWSPSFETGNI